uniref:Tumor necrosis factor alpha-induced protein 8-like protein n=1 Tax=Romanomermis culicivorax TaxID=13658 RepID=A0A915I2Z5_ROMCU
MNDSNASGQGQTANGNFSVQSLSLKVQKKVLGKMTSRNVAKRFVSDTTAEILDNLYKLLKQHYTKKDAEKVIKNILKLTIKLGVLVRNDQLSCAQRKQLNVFLMKFRQICLTCISFRSVEFSYDQKYLSDLLEKCRQTLKPIIDVHLSDKSDQRLQHVFNFVNDGHFLDAVFKRIDQTENFLDKVCANLNIAMENGEI